jgi:ribose transport system permease protein
MGPTSSDTPRRQDEPSLLAPVEPAPPSAHEDDETWRQRTLEALSFRNISAAYVLVGFIVLFAIWVPDTFLTTTTLKSILYENSVTAILAVGLVVPFAAGAFDISIGATLGVAAVLLGVLVTDQDMAWPLGIAITVLAGAVIGAVNGFMVVKAQIDSIIATLASMSILTGLALAIGNNRVFIDYPPGFTKLGTDSFLGISLPVWCLLVIALICWYVLERTAMGRSVSATGGGLEAARLAGVRTRQCIFWALVASATVAAIAGVVATARVGSSQADLGPPYLLPAFAAVFLGGTQFKNGRFNVWGSILATYTLAVGVAGLTQAGGPIWLPDVFNGLALAIAVSLTVRRRRIRVAEPDTKADPPSEPGSLAAPGVPPVTVTPRDG